MSWFLNFCWRTDLRKKQLFRIPPRLSRWTWCRPFTPDAVPATHAALVPASARQCCTYFSTSLGGGWRCAGRPVCDGVFEQWASTSTACISTPNMVGHDICRHSYAVERGLVVGVCGQPHCCYRPCCLTARFRSPSSCMVSGGLFMVRSGPMSC